MGKAHAGVTRMLSGMLQGCLVGNLLGLDCPELH